MELSPGSSTINTFLALDLTTLQQYIPINFILLQATQLYEALNYGFMDSSMDMEVLGVGSSLQQHLTLAIYLYI